jgi:hypothetical protein
VVLTIDPLVQNEGHKVYCETVIEDSFTYSLKYENAQCCTMYSKECRTFLFNKTMYMYDMDNWTCYNQMCEKQYSCICILYSTCHYAGEDLYHCKKELDILESEEL